MTRSGLPLVLLAACMFSLQGQPPPADAPPPPPGATVPAGERARRPPPEPKNLQVLKVPPTELIPMMRTWSASLGVQCQHCHVQGNFAADDKPTKLLARKMYLMNSEINEHYAAINVKISCFTCHRGNIMPEVNPPVQENARPAGAGGANGPTPPPAAPPPPQH